MCTRLSITANRNKGAGAHLLVGLCLTSLLFSGCAAKQSTALMQDTPSGISSSARVDHVPFFPQQDYQCGPAALAMVLGHAGVDVTPEQLRPDLFIPDKQGSLQVEMMAMPRRYGMLGYQLAPALSKLLQEVQAGHPVIVFQNLGLSLAPQWHYAVVTGFDLGKKNIRLHSGNTPDYTMPLSTFEHTWVRAGSWGMLVLPTGELPASADEKAYLMSVLMLEKEGFHQAALKSYTAASRRWPESLAARLGLGNSQYTLGLLDEAQQTFLQATHDFPGAGEAYNNLAQTYLDQQRYELARTTIERAINIDNSSALYRKTRQEIEQASVAQTDQHPKTPASAARQ